MKQSLIIGTKTFRAKIISILPNQNKQYENKLGHAYFMEYTVTLIPINSTMLELTGSYDVTVTDIFIDQV